MANTPILEVDIDPAGKFKEFQENFAKFQAMLAKVPGGWNAAAMAAAAASVPIKNQITAINMVTAATKAATQAQANLAKAQAKAQAAQAAAAKAQSAGGAQAAAATAKAQAAATALANAQAKAQAAQTAVATAQAKAQAQAAAQAQTRLMAQIKAQAAAQAAAQKAQETAQKKRDKEAERARKEAIASVTDLASKTGTIASNIESATKNLLKWVGISGAIGGLIGLGGGLLGLDALAASAGNMLRSSRGLGVSSAQEQAFGINYRRYVDPDSMLAQVQDAKNDYAKRWAFSALGLNQNQVQNEDAATLSTQIIQAAKGLYASSSDHSQQFFDSHGLGTFMSYQDWTRIGATSQGDLNGSQQNYNRDLQKFALDPRTLKAWQDFQVRIEDTGAALKDVLIRRLVTLAPALGHLADSVGKVITTFLDQPQLTTWINDAAAGLNSLATYIGTPKFQQDVAAFAHDIGVLAGAVWNAVQWFVKVFGHPPGSGPIPSAPASQGGIGGGSGIAVPAGGFPNTPLGRTESYLQNIRGPGSPGYGNESNAALAMAVRLGQGPGQVESFLRANGDALNAAKDAWCAAFVNAALRSVGVKGTGSDVANSFETWGKAISPANVQQGDVLDLTRGLGPGVVGGHVGLATGRTRIVNGQLQIQMLAGNSGGGAGSVQATWENASSLMIRRSDGSGGLINTYPGGAPGIANNNLGNIRNGWMGANGVPLGLDGRGFVQFKTPADSLSAIYDQIGLYEKRDHLSTLTDILSKYDSGDSAGKLKSYIAGISQESGIGAKQNVNFADSDMMGRLISAMINRETGTKMAPAQVMITIRNNTGSSVNINANQLPRTQ